MVQAGKVKPAIVAKVTTICRRAHEIFIGIRPANEQLCHACFYLYTPYTLSTTSWLYVYSNESMKKSGESEEDRKKC